MLSALLVSILIFGGMSYHLPSSHDEEIDNQRDNGGINPYTGCWM